MISGRLLKSESGNYGRRGTSSFIVPLSQDLKKNKGGGVATGTTTVINNRNGSIYSSINPVIETYSSDDDDGSSDNEGIDGGKRSYLIPSSSQPVVGDSDDHQIRHKK